MNPIEEEKEEAIDVRDSNETVNDSSLNSSGHAANTSSQTNLNTSETTPHEHRINIGLQYRNRSDHDFTGTTATPTFPTPPNYVPLGRKNSVGAGVLSNLIRYMAVSGSATDLGGHNLSRQTSTNLDFLMRRSSLNAELRTSPEFRRGSMFGVDRRASMKSIKVGGTFAPIPERRLSLASAFRGGFGLMGRQGNGKDKFADIDGGIDPEILRDAIAADIEETLKRQDFLMKLCKGFWLYGCPSYRLSLYMTLASETLGVEASYAFFPSLLLISFGDPDTHTSETHFVKCSQGYNLHKLQCINDLAIKVTSTDPDKIDIDECIDSIDEILLRPPLYPKWFKIIQTATNSFVLVLGAFGGSWDGALVAAVEGAIVGALNLLAGRFTAYSNLLELTASMAVGFIARIGSAYLENGCFWSLALSGICSMLPGLGLTMSVTELAARNVVIGTTRLTYSLIIALMLGFGLGIGSKFAFWVEDNVATKTCWSIPNWSQWLLFPVLCMTFNLNLSSHYRQWPSIFLVATIGYTVANVSEAYIEDDGTATALSAFVIGVVGNVYGRVTNTLAIVPTLPAILTLLPGSLALRGASAFLDSDVINGTSFALQVITCAVSVCVGLFVANLFVFPIKHKRAMGRNITF